MTSEDAKQVLKLVIEYWPQTDWPRDVLIEFARRLTELPLTFQQAKAKLLEARFRSRFRMIEPSEAIEALKRYDIATQNQTVIDAKKITLIEQTRLNDSGRYCTAVLLAHALEPALPARFALTPNAYTTVPYAYDVLARILRDELTAKERALGEQWKGIANAEMKQLTAENPDLRQPQLRAMVIARMINLREIGSLPAPPGSAPEKAVASPSDKSMLQGHEDRDGEEEKGENTIAQSEV